MLHLVIRGLPFDHFYFASHIIRRDRDVPIVLTLTRRRERTQNSGKRILARFQHGQCRIGQ